MVDTGVVTDTDMPLKVKGSPLIRSLYIVDSVGGTKLLTFGLGQEAPKGGISAVVSSMPLKMKGMSKPKAKTSTRAGEGSERTTAEAAVEEEEVKEEEEEGAAHIVPPSGVILSDFHAGEITGNPSYRVEHNNDPHLQHSLTITASTRPLSLVSLPSIHLFQAWIVPHWSTLP